jgi:inner membrane transporter RhtA
VTTPSSAPVGAPAPTLALASMGCAQIGAAASMGLFDEVGSGGTTWLRLTWAAVFFLALTRPSLRTLPRGAVLPAFMLGLVTATMTLCFFAAVGRIPLGTATALEFLGPLGVAFWRSPSRRAMLWPALALAGVLAMTEPWTGDTDLVGVGLALGSACCYAAYVVLTQRVGDELSGSTGLAVSMPVAAAVAAFVGLPQAAGSLDLGILWHSALAALLLPVIPYALEMSALRRLTAAAFGTLMSMEPAVAMLVGLLALGQAVHATQLAGVAAVVVAGVGAARVGRRTDELVPAQASTGSSLGSDTASPTSSAVRNLETML